MNSEDKGYLNKNNNAVKDNASGWVLTTSFGASIISGMLIGLLITWKNRMGLLFLWIPTCQYL